MTNFEEMAGGLSKIEERVASLENNNKRSTSPTSSQVIKFVQEKPEPKPQVKNQEDTGRNLLYHI